MSSELPDGAAEVYKLHGAPGAGKTHRLLEHVEEEQERGVTLDNALYLTFTNAGQEEAAERLVDVFQEEKPEDVEKRARTLHSAALKVCREAGFVEDVREQVIDDDRDEDVYERFAARNGLRFGGGPTDPQGLYGTTPEETEGERLFAAGAWFKSAYKPLTVEKYHGTGGGDGLPQHLRPPMRPKRAVELLQKWETFKREDARDLPVYEHDDYVKMAIEHSLVPDVDVLFVDEFQDLSPLQYKLFKVWRNSGRIKRIYIAGDVNQAIYGFRGASPYYLGATPATGEEFRTLSWRCPGEIAAVGSGILSACNETDPRGFAARAPGGTVTNPRLETGAALGAGVRGDLQDHDETGDETGASIFLLTRTNSQVNTIASALQEQGVPYKRLGKDWGAWDDDLTRIYHALDALRSGDTIPVPGVRALFEALSDREAQRREFLLGGGGSGDPTDDPGFMWDHLDDAQVFANDDLRRAFGEDVTDVATSLAELSNYQQEALEHALATGGEPTDPARVQVGTIHSAKGLEAPCVYLFDDYGAKLRQHYHDDAETRAEEHRLYYVGATRASQTLRVVSGFGNSRDVFPPLEDGLPRDDDAVGGTEVEA